MQHRGRSPLDLIMAQADLTATCLATLAQSSPSMIRAMRYIASWIEWGTGRATDAVANINHSILCSNFAVSLKIQRLRSSLISPASDLCKVKWRKLPSSLWDEEQFRLTVTRDRKEERKEQHSLGGPPYPDHLPGHTGEGDCGQIRVERIRKLIRRVEGTMREQPASPTQNVGDSTFKTQDRLVNINQEETMKALGSNNRFVWALFLSSEMSILTW